MFKVSACGVEKAKWLRYEPSAFCIVATSKGQPAFHTPHFQYYPSFKESGKEEMFKQQQQNAYNFRKRATELSDR